MTDNNDNDNNELYNGVPESQPAGQEPDKSGNAAQAHAGEGTAAGQSGSAPTSDDVSCASRNAGQPAPDDVKAVPVSYAFVPSGGAQPSSSASGTHVHGGANRKRGKKRAMQVAAAVLACVVCSGVGGATGAITASKLIKASSSSTASSSSAASSSRQTTSSAATGSQTTSGSTATTSSGTAAATLGNGSQSTTSINASNASYSTKDIYANSVDSVVGVVTTIQETVDSMFGSQTQSGTASGSGFIISSDGYIVTNYHVIEDGTAYKVTTHDGTEYDATVVGYEESNDIAVLKIDATGLQAVTLGFSADLSVGDELVVIGNPLGELTDTLTTGVVSALNRTVSNEGVTLNMFQTDAAINAGNSGGPIFNMQGQVVGIATSKYASSTIEGLCFAIPIDDVKDMISDIISYGYVTGRASLGVSVQTITQAMSMRYNYPVGCYIVEVGSGTAADNAGLAKGDVITKVGDTTIESVDDLSSALAASSAGQSAVITYVRSGSTRTVTVTFDEKKPAEARTTYSNVYDY